MTAAWATSSPRREITRTSIPSSTSHLEASSGAISTTGFGKADARASERRVISPPVPVVEHATGREQQRKLAVGKFFGRKVVNGVELALTSREGVDVQNRRAGMIL